MLQPIATIIGCLTIVYGCIKLIKYCITYSVKQKEKKEFNQQLQNAKDCLAQMEKNHIEEIGRLMENASEDDITRYHEVLRQVIDQVRRIIDFYSSTNLSNPLNVPKKHRSFFEEMVIADAETNIKKNYEIIAKNLKDMEALMHKNAPVH